MTSSNHSLPDQQQQPPQPPYHHHDHEHRRTPQPPPAVTVPFPSDQEQQAQMALVHLRRLKQTSPFDVGHVSRFKDTTEQALGKEGVIGGIRQYNRHSTRRQQQQGWKELYEVACQMVEQLGLDPDELDYYDLLAMQKHRTFYPHLTLYGRFVLREAQRMRIDTEDLRKQLGLSYNSFWSFLAGRPVYPAKGSRHSASSETGATPVHQSTESHRIPGLRVDYTRLGLVLPVCELLHGDYEEHLIRFFAGRSPDMQAVASLVVALDLYSQLTPEQQKLIRLSMQQWVTVNRDARLPDPLVSLRDLARQALSPSDDMSETQEAGQQQQQQQQEPDGS